MPDEAPERIFTPDELSLYITVPTRTLDQWRYLGKGPAYFRAGKHVRYRASAVAAWLDAESDKTRAA